MFKRAICTPVWLFVLLLLVAACRRESAALSEPSTPTPPALRHSLEEAGRVAADFLNAWVMDNYDAMYTLLTTNSRDAYGRADFEKLYRDTEAIFTLKPGGKTYTLTQAINQGATAQIAYDMTFDTQLFGQFTDPNRVMLLVSTAEGWRVGWTPGDILAEFKNGASLRVDQTQPNRGNIYGRDGEVIADQNGRLVVVTLRTRTYPGNNPDACFARLAEVFRARTAEQMKEIFGPRTGEDYIYEIGALSHERFAEVRPAIEEFCTLEYSSRPARRYVAGGLAPHVVGYVGQIPAEQVEDYVARGYPRDALVGIDGIERYWESALAGRGALSLNVTLRGVILRTLAEIPAVPSQSVYLTLDVKLQQAVQDMLRDAFTTSVWGKHAPGAAAVVMDVRTGEILAIASYPDFNVDAFNPNTSLPNAQELIRQWSSDPRRPTFNRATLGIYPPGSVFKIVSMAAALDSGQFQLNSRYTCSGVWNGQTFGDIRRTDWIYHTDQRQHGNITLRQALAGSCNIWFWHIGWTMNGVDPHLWPDYARRMGFGAPTGIVGVSEAAGELPDPDAYERATGRKYSGSQALNAVIGQGDVLVTPLQIARMVAAVANGGTLYEPLLVRQTGIIGEPSFVAEPKPNGTLGFNPGVLEGIRQSMCLVVSDPTIGTAYFVFKDFEGGAVICGKTGTAQSGAGTLPHAWFAAFAGKTADEPEIAIAVVVEKSNEGSFISAPIVRRIVETYYGLPITPWPSWYGGGLPAAPGVD